MKPLGMLYACAGCPEFGYAAPRVAQRVEQRGLAEAAWLGTAARAAAVSTRFPLYALDACAKGCAREWAEAQGAAIEASFVLDPLERDDPDRAAERLAAVL